MGKILVAARKASPPTTLRDCMPKIGEHHKVGVRHKCLAQFASVEPGQHHRVTLQFLDPMHQDSLRPDIDKMAADGSNMSSKLSAVVKALAWVPLDHSVCEGPHARAKRIKMPASAAKWAWLPRCAFGRTSTIARAWPVSCRFRFAQHGVHPRQWFNPHQRPGGRPASSRLSSIAGCTSWTT